jgi:hypothetical protein
MLEDIADAVLRACVPPRWLISRRLDPAQKTHYTALANHDYLRSLARGPIVIGINMKFARNGTSAASRQGVDDGHERGDVFLSAAQVRRRYGGVSAMTLHRWLQSSKLEFCKPIFIGNRRYWRLSDLEKFERRRVGEKAPTNQAQCSRSANASLRTGRMST